MRAKMAAKKIPEALSAARRDAALSKATAWHENEYLRLGNMKLTYATTRLRRSKRLIISQVFIPGGMRLTLRELFDVARERGQKPIMPARLRESLA